MRFTVEQWAQIEYDFQEALWANYEATSDDLKAHVPIARPPERLTLEQHQNKIELSRRKQHYFSMANVVTGARRNWQQRYCHYHE